MLHKTMQRHQAFPSTNMSQSLTKLYMLHIHPLTCHASHPPSNFITGVNPGWLSHALCKWNSLICIVCFTDDSRGVPLMQVHILTLLFLHTSEVEEATSY